MRRYVHILYAYLYCGYANEEGKQMCAEVQNETFLVKIAKSNVMPTLRRFCWYSYFVALEYVVSGIRGKQMLPKFLNEAFLAKITII